MYLKTLKRIFVLNAFVLNMSVCIQDNSIKLVNKFLKKQDFGGV